MRGYSRGTLIALILLLGTACVPRQIKPVASIDPAPFLTIIHERQAILEHGLSGSLELSFRSKQQRYNGKVFVVAHPDGRFRLEVPGPFGGTHLVMASDNIEIIAFYPGEGKAYRSTVNGRSINPHLPFPLPVEPAMLSPMIMGALPRESGISGAQAHLMSSGEKLLQAAASDGNLRYSWIFEKSSENCLDDITIRGKDVKVRVRPADSSPYLPLDFSLVLADSTLKGEWDTAAPFIGNHSVFDIRLPDSIIVTDLETSP